MIFIAVSRTGIPYSMTSSKRLNKVLSNNSGWFVAAIIRPWESSFSRSCKKRIQHSPNLTDIIGLAPASTQGTEFIEEIDTLERPRVRRQQRAAVALDGAEIIARSVIRSCFYPTPLRVLHFRDQFPENGRLYRE